MMREIDGGDSSHLSQNSTIAHFGLGSATTIDSVIITWTGGYRQVLTGQPVNTLLTVVEPEQAGGNPALYAGLVAVLALIGLMVFRSRAG